MFNVRLKEIHSSRHRWLLHAYADVDVDVNANVNAGTNYADLCNFRDWIKENFPECLCKMYITYNSNKIGYADYVEVRGSCQSDLFMIKLLNF